MNSEQFYSLLEKNLESILDDPKFDNYRKQIFAWRLSASFKRTYDEAYLWNRALYLSSNGGLLLSDPARRKLAIKTLTASAEIYEYLGRISEYYDRQYAILLSSLCYDLAGYQANALCLTRRITEYQLESGDSEIGVSTDNYVLQHVKQILLKNIVKAKEILRSDLNVDLGIEIFNNSISKWYDNVLDGIDTDFHEAVYRSYKYYLNAFNLPISHLMFLLKTRLDIYRERSVWANLRKTEAIKNSLVWTKYIKLLTHDTYANNRIKDVEKRVSKFEFWLSQLRAIEKGLLESDENFVIQMPTSAGKTFIAEISILNQLVKRPGKKCIYIAPFRALTNEKETEIGTYLSKLGFSVSALSGSYEMDEFQQIILEDTDVLIATPEKIDLLFRLKPSYFEDVAFVVVDEGQIVGDISARASLLEFLIIRLKMKLDSVKFLFISAVMPSQNADEYSLWLSGKDTNVIRSLQHRDSPEDEQWEPTRKLIGRFMWDGNNGRIDFKNVETEDEGTGRKNPAFVPSIIRVGQYGNSYPKKDNKAQIAASLGFELSKDGKCLIFCSQPRFTKSVGEALLKIIQVLEENHEIAPEHFKDDVNKESYFFASQWYGPESYISKCLRRGIGVHYGDMPEPVRRSVESDYSSEGLKVLIATSTVGQGLNFPIKHLIVHSTIIGHNGGPAIVSVRDFWNIIGRAGRAGQETEGQVTFIVKSNQDILSYERLTERSNIEPAYSMLFNVLDALVGQRIEQTNYEEFMKTLSEPYLLSLLVEEAVGTEDEDLIENIISNSLFKVQVEKHEKDLQPIRNSFRTIITNINDKVPDRGLVKVYGETGFNLRSNQAIDSYIETNREQLEAIVKADNYVDLIELALKLFDLGEIQEIRSNKLQAIELQPHEFFGIIKSWVEGKDIQQLQFEWRQISDNIEHLNVLISDGLYYRYTWAFTAFITILCSKLDIVWDDLPENIRSLSSYIKFGLNNPTACLARSLGIKNRGTAMLLSNKSENISGRAFIKWVANLTMEDLVTFDVNQYDKRNIIDTALKLNPNRYNQVPTEFDFYIRGIPFEHDRIQNSLMISVGNKLSYQRDIGNLYDPFAIKIFFEGKELGFVPREFSRTISTEIDLNQIEYEIVVTNTGKIKNYQNIEAKMRVK